VSVIKEQTSPQGVWYCKIRVFERPGLASDVYIYDRDMLLPNTELSRAIYKW